MMINKRSLLAAGIGFGAALGAGRAIAQTAVAGATPVGGAGNHSGWPNNWSKTWGQIFRIDFV